jgi:hypothetical protein
MEKFPKNLISDYIKTGQAYLAECVKILICRADEVLFTRLPFEEDGPFLEPYLFAYFSHQRKPAMTLRQILFGYCTQKIPEPFEVKADGSGIIYLPNVGYLRCNAKDTLLMLSCNGERDFQLTHDGREVPHEFEPLSFIPGTDIEVVRYFNPFFAFYFAEWRDDVKDFGEFNAPVEIQHTTAFHLDHLSAALRLVREFSPEQYMNYVDTTRRVVLFNNPAIRNFAVRDLHGMIFLSARENSSEIYFMEELVHQCSHNVFNAVTARKQDHFIIDPEKKSLKDYSGVDTEFRSIYSAYHGLYTVATRLECFRDCMDVVEGSDLHELLGRFADLRRRFRNGLEVMPLKEVFTSEGRLLYKHLDTFCDNQFGKYVHLLGKFDYSNQGSDFDFDLFKELNPASRVLEVAGSVS